MQAKRILRSILLTTGFVLISTGCVKPDPSAKDTSPDIASIPPAAAIATPTITFLPTPSVAAQPTSNIGIRLRRGVNLANMLEAPVEGELGLTAHEEYFSLIKQAGFDFVRLPIRWDTHAALTAPYTIGSKFFDRVDEIIGWAIQHNLAIILDFHNFDGIMKDPVENRARFLGIWRQIAEHYQAFPPQVVFELLNEPNDVLNAAIWNQYLRAALDIIRLSNPSREVVIGSAQASRFDWITTLDVPDDPNIIVTFHYYEPFHFTHQGANWIGQDTHNWLGTTWDATTAQDAVITENFDLVANWASQHHVRILLGEFGAFSAAELASRVRWTSYVARQAELHRFAWAFWEFAAGFGIYDPNTNTWRQQLLKALIPPSAN